MAQFSSTNYQNPQFTWATTTTDQFRITDLQNLGQAVEAHDHSNNNGLAVARVAASATIGAGSTLITPVFSGNPTGDGLLLPRLIGMPYLATTTPGALTITDTANHSVASGSLTINSPSSGLVLITSRLKFAISSNASLNDMTVYVTVDSGTNFPANQPVNSTYTVVSSGTWSWTNSAIVQVTSGAHTFTLGAKWEGIVGSPSAVLQCDTRMSSVQVVQLA